MSCLIYGSVGCVSNNSNAFTRSATTCAQHVLHMWDSNASELMSHTLTHTRMHFPSCRKQGVQCESLHMWYVLAVTFPSGGWQPLSPTGVSCHNTAKTSSYCNKPVIHLIASSYLLGNFHKLSDRSLRLNFIKVLQLDSRPQSRVGALEIVVS